MTPNSLKIVLQLMIFVFLAMITISSINLYIVIIRSDKLYSELYTIKESYER